MRLLLPKKTQKLWLWKIIDHRDKNLIEWSFGQRDTKTLIKMYDRMGFEEIPHVYADCYECYKEFFPSKNLTQSKRYTSPIERNNGRQRHWLAAFRRRSIVVTKSIENLEKTMALFARFRINGSIDELLALLK